MSAHLTYRARDGIVSGVVAGKPTWLATVRHPADADVHNWGKAQEIRSGKTMLGAPGRKLTVAENAPVETYDWPGVYAQRLDGVRRVAGSSAARPRHMDQGQNENGVPERGICLHEAPGTQAHYGPESETS